MRRIKWLLGLIVVCLIAFEVPSDTAFAADVGRGVWVGDEYIDHFCILPCDGLGIEVGETAEISVVNIPAGYDESDVEWYYDEEHVTFDGKKLTGVAPGVCTLTAEIFDEDNCEIERTYIIVTVYALSGSCSTDEVQSDLIWKMDPDTGVLTISGQGEMPDYISGYSDWLGGLSNAPWFPTFQVLGINNELPEDGVDVVVEEGVTSVGTEAFLAPEDTYMLRISTLSLSDSIVRLGRYLGRFTLTSSYLPENLEVVEASAFSNANFPDERVYFPDGIKSLGDYSFRARDGEGLTEAYFYGDAPVEFGENVFPDSDGFVIYYIPGTSDWTDSDAYDTTTGKWNGYTLKPWAGPLQLLSRSPEVGGVVSGSDLTVSMTFNHEIQSVQAKAASYDLLVVQKVEKEGGSYAIERVYQLSAGDHLESDVTVDGCTLTIRASDASLTLGGKYYIVMAPGVVTFKDTDEQFSIGQTDITEWSFSYQPRTSLRGFTLGKHNNSFCHTNKSVERAGFAGVEKITLSLDKYLKLMSFASTDIAEQLRITLRLTALPEWDGACYGVSATMLLAYRDILQISQLESGVSNYFDLSLPCENEEFIDCINYFFLSQHFVDHQGASGDEIGNLLLDMICTLNTDPVIFGYKTPNSGHAILALDYEVDQNGDYIVYMYDLNSYWPDHGGFFTLLKIKSDFSDYSLVQPDGPVLYKKDISYVEYSALDQLNQIDPYGSTRMSTGSSRATVQDQSGEPGYVDISVPASAVSYTITNSAGETLVCDESGRFSGTMELVDVRMIAHGDGAGEWQLTVPYADSFQLTKTGASADVILYTNNGCFGVQSERIGDIRFDLADRSITILDNGEEYEYTAFLSHNMIDDDSVRIVKITAVSSGTTTLTVQNGSAKVSSGGPLTAKELTLIDGLSVLPLTDLDEVENVIEVSTVTPEGATDHILSLVQHTANTAKVRFSNNTGAALSADFVLAAYDAEGRMVGVETISDELEHLDSTALTVTSTGNPIALVKGFILDRDTKAPLAASWQQRLES